MEDKADGGWELKSSLAGFVNVAEAHTGVRLGQAMYKVLQRIGIAHKVCSSQSTDQSRQPRLPLMAGRLGNIRQREQQHNDDDGACPTTCTL